MQETSASISPDLMILLLGGHYSFIILLLCKQKLLTVSDVSTEMSGKTYPKGK